MDLSSTVTQLNDAKENTGGSYILYWMQMFKRASHNYALNFAIRIAKHGEEVQGTAIHGFQYEVR